MAIEVVAYRAAWPALFVTLQSQLAAALHDVEIIGIEHVGSTAVPDLAAKPVLDVDVIVTPSNRRRAIKGLETAGYVHLGDLGLAGRDAFDAPVGGHERHVYICIDGSLSLRNHLAVRDILRRRDDLRREYSATKLALAADPAMTIEAYLAGKSSVLQKVLAESVLSLEERRQILCYNDPDATAEPGARAGS
jgi:GrpB-like predicted nucleotidyltransferase (UPF0157 family)